MVASDVEIGCGFGLCRRDGVTWVTTVDGPVKVCALHEAPASTWPTAPGAFMEEAPTADGRSGPLFVVD